jgi:uncharacterized membrane protein YidH (DUF202 family)
MSSPGKISPADRRRLVTKLALVTSGLVVLGAAITAVRPDAGTSPAGRKTVPVKRKPNKAVLAALAVAHVAVTALTWRDLRRRPAGQVRGNKTFWRMASTLNMGNSAVYWLFGRRPAGKPQNCE